MRTSIDDAGSSPSRAQSGLAPIAARWRVAVQGVDLARPVWLNGCVVPLAEAALSPLDRGFLFADGVYEVIPVYQGRAFAWSEHYQRLERSLAAIDLPNPLTETEWRSELGRLLRAVEDFDRAAGRDLGRYSIYLQLSRGVAPRDHAYPLDAMPTAFAQITRMADPAPLQAQGVAAISIEDKRWNRCDIKSVSLLPNVMAREEARRTGAAEALLFRKDQLREGAASNAFVVLDGRVVTPPLAPDLLPGVTRNWVLKVVADLGLRWAEAPVSIDDVSVADEIWLTSSTKEILPVVALNDGPVGAGVPGPIFTQVSTAYRLDLDNPACSIALAGGSSDIGESGHE
ncbi:MAG: aminotransferase class IV [Thioalkalivibrionaceae bacterium]